MRIHFIAIGGSAMHNLALALYAKGELISGSDDAIFEPSKSRLSKAGILPSQLGWDANKITSDIDAVILGMHAKADNPELLKAQELGLQIYSYPEFIYQMSQNKTRVVIGGSHGKTTITSMVLHVMAYHNIEVDYLVGAQLPGFDTMVKLTCDNEFIVIEGDEYLASALDPRPKFHLYRPNIALISGIAWDHINVFPTHEDYVKQFEIFLHKIVDGGILIYNELDPVLDELVHGCNQPIRKLPYQLPDYSIESGVTYLNTQEGPLPLEIFGEHNLSNLCGAQWVCQNMGVDLDDFNEAIASFSGASKRLEKLMDNGDTIVFKDFAHAPSKVIATTTAVKTQFKDKILIASLELHTYSSLNPEFLVQYKSALQSADIKIVFYSKDALAIKGLPAISELQIREAFQQDDLIVFTDSQQYRDYLYQCKKANTVFLLMSSGNYGNLDLNDFINHLIT